MIYPFPHPLLLPLGKVIEHDAIGRKIVRQPSPGATLPHKIMDRLEDRSLTITRRPPQLAAKWKQLLQNISFFTISARMAVPRMSGGAPSTLNAGRLVEIAVKPWVSVKIPWVGVTIQ